VSLREGPQGVQGEQGPPGPDKELQTRQRASPFTLIVNPGQTSTSTASCAPGEVATGGGIFVDDRRNAINPRYVELGSPTASFLATR
jgi:hypothetical protein